VRSVSFGALVRDVSDLLDYLIDRFAVVGSTDEVVNRFRRLVAQGATSFCVITRGPSAEDQLRLIGHEVISRVTRTKDHPAWK
jgi:alkanesulfonate monooxygenase SsuD/methylene tetrahydromethanopterin reductase-like flavin-dependent oxidoreductase (luciferase family)